MHRAARRFLAILLLVGATACGDDDGALPPEEEPELAELVQPHLDRLDLEFTYGGLEDLPGGQHLALYVEPSGSATDQDYLDRLLASTLDLAPFLFDAYPGLNSFDVCQEPVPTGPDDPERPTPRTVLVMGRRQAATVDDWSTATLADVIVATRTGRGGEVRVDDAIAQLPGYVEALAEADRRSPPSEEDAGY